MLATVLLYNDGKGHQMVAAGRTPQKIYKAIKEDIKIHHGNTTAEVVPLFNQIAAAPTASEMADCMKQRIVYDKFKDVYVVNIPKWLASKVVGEKRKRMLFSKVKNDRLDDLARDDHNVDKAVNTNSISEGKIEENSFNKSVKMPKTYYFPNTVIYGIETKCKTPADYSCYTNNKSNM